MSQLHNAINSYFRDLETLQTQYPSRQDFLDAAEKKWGQQSPEYLFLTEGNLQRWSKKNPPGNPPVEQLSWDDEDNIAINWMSPIREELAKYPDDDDLLRIVKEKYGRESFLYRLLNKLL
ncbi:MAG: hypothetical protein KAI83_05400 [Thiomargarita sp.]|nr:hypothetical protein [Thiomargarita sp.]